MLRCLDGGDAGGVAGVRTSDAGAGPGEQTGRCLFGIGEATIFPEVFMLNEGARGGGVGD